MGTQIQLGGIQVDVILKPIKNVHLSVHPPGGLVRISAPDRMDMNTIRAFAISKLGWIRKQQDRLRAQAREAAREYMERETHFVWGRRYLMEISETTGRAFVERRHAAIILHVPAGAPVQRRHAVMQEWYRGNLKDAIEPLRAKWEPVIGVQPASVTVWRMKTLWGSCSSRRRTIRINLELVRKPPQCLEYILVHELIHLLEPTHNARFIAHMDRLMPEWRHLRDELNRLPVPHEDWGY